MYKKLSYISLSVIILCPILSFLFGLSVIPSNFNYADLLPIGALNAFYMFWFFGVLLSFAIPVFVLVKHVEAKLPFAPAKFFVAGIISVSIFGSSVFVYLWYLGLRLETFHAL